MTGPAEPVQADDGKVPEVWAYAGIRVNTKGKRFHAWIDQAGAGTQLTYTDSGRWIVGGLYDVRVARDSSGVTRTYPKWAGSHVADRDLLLEWSARDAAARARLAALARERSALKQDALDEALQPLLDIAAKLRVQADRDAFLATIIRRVGRAW